MEKIKLPNKALLHSEYAQYEDARNKIALDMLVLVENVLKPMDSHPTVKTRHKDFHSYYKKYLKLLNQNKETDAPTITDLIGLRVICPFIEDIEIALDEIKNALEVLEVERKGAQYSFKEFGYESLHLLVRIPDGIIKERGRCGVTIAEIQIRTILQDAWAEVEHELVYKSEFTPYDPHVKRKLAALNANLYLADNIFQGIRQQQHEVNGQLKKRHDTFYIKIDETVNTSQQEEKRTDETPEGEQPLELEQHFSSDSIDNLLLKALYAHNKNKFDEAIQFYSRILELEPDHKITSVIFKHRALSYFAQSRYENALLDFTKSLDLDPSSHRALYYRGLVKSVLQNYLEAIEDYNQSLALDPYQPFCHYRLSQAYYHLKDYPEALANIDNAIKLDFEKQEFREFRSTILRKIKM
ncbi:tetratricopeptide repeat protein [Breznakiellaceae bacterium SP9]